MFCTGNTALHINKLSNLVTHLVTRSKQPLQHAVFKRNANACSLNAIVDVRRRRHDMIFFKYATYVGN